MDWIARKLFPRLSPARRQYELRRFGLVLALGVVLAALIGLVLYYLNLQHRI